MCCSRSLHFSCVASAAHFFWEKGDNMKSCGIVRKTDNLGRIVLPKEVRKKFSIEKDDLLEIFTDGEMIVLKKGEKKKQ